MITREAFEAMLTKMSVVDLGNMRDAVGRELTSRAIGGSDGLTTEEAESVRHNNKIAAIRSVRERLGLGLRESKEFVERHS